MQYILNEEEYKRYMDNLHELAETRVYNEKLVKENQRLTVLESELKEIKVELNKCIRVTLGPRESFSKTPDKITKSTIRKHYITNLILGYSDVKELYDVEQIIDTITYE